MTTEYKIELKRYEGEIKLVNYVDDDEQFKSSTPTGEKDFKVVENLKWLMKELFLEELNATIKIK